MIAAVRRALDRHAGRGQHSPRTAAARRHPAGSRLATTDTTGDTAR